MDDQLQQIGTSITWQYYGMLDNFLEGAGNVFQVSPESSHLYQLEEDINLFTVLEEKFKSLQTIFNAGFTSVEMEQEAPSELPPSNTGFNPDLLPMIKAKHSPASTSKSIHSGFEKADRTDKLPSDIRENISSDNDGTDPTLTNPHSSDKKITFSDKFKTEGPSINPLDNKVVTEQTTSEPFDIPEFPKNNLVREYHQQTRQVKDAPPSDLTPQKNQARKSQALGNLSDFARHFATDSNQNQDTEIYLNSNTAPQTSQTQKNPQVKDQKQIYTPAPQNLKSFADFISQQPATPPNPQNPTSQNSSPQQPTTSYQLPATSHNPQPTPAAPKPAKLNHGESTFKNEDQITDIKNSLISNPSYVKQFLSTDNQPLPAEVDYDELIDKLAKHLYWEYKRYYGK